MYLAVWSNSSWGVKKFRLSLKRLSFWQLCSYTCACTTCMCSNAWHPLHISGKWPSQLTPVCRLVYFFLPLHANLPGVFSLCLVPPACFLCLEALLCFPACALHRFYILPFFPPRPRKPCLAVFISSFLFLPPATCFTVLGPMIFCDCSHHLHLLPYLALLFQLLFGLLAACFLFPHMELLARFALNLLFACSLLCLH